MPNLHPVFVHFPIALIAVITFCEIAALLTRRTIFREASVIMAIFALLGAIASVATGLAAEETVWHDDAGHELMEIHETVGLIFLGIIILYSTFRVVFRNRYGITSWICTFLAVVGLGVVFYTGYLGGEMVFRHGVGVKAVELLSVDKEKQQKEEFEKYRYDSHEDSEDRNDPDRHQH